MKRFNATAISGLTAYELSRVVARTRRFKGISKAVLRALIDHYPKVWVKVENTLVDESGFSVASVRRALTELVDENWICPVSATKEHPKGRRGGKNQSEQYVINDRKILNTLAAQKLEDGIASGKIPTIDTQSQGSGIGTEKPSGTQSQGPSNPITVEPNPICGKHTQSGRASNPIREIEEEVIEENIEEIKEEKREERDQKSPSAPPPPHTAKPKPSRSRSTGGQEIDALVQDIKKVALDASEGKAVFYGKNTKAIEEALRSLPSPDRDSILSAVRNRVRDMDEFQLKHCGSELAEMLVALIEYKYEAREARARQAEQEAARMAEIHAEIAERHKAEEQERARERSEAEEITRSSVGLFGEPFPVTGIPG
jgi:hypothetical protein